MKGQWRDGVLIFAGLLQAAFGYGSHAQAQVPPPGLDARVAQFLQDPHRAGEW
jgi:hypothetical protein